MTYGRIVYDLKPNEDEKYRTRLTVDGDRIICTYDISTSTVELITVKLLLNSVILTPKVKFTTIAIKIFYLNTHMPNYEYARMPITLSPQNIIDQYRLQDIVTIDGYVYMEIGKGFFDHLKQAN